MALQTGAIAPHELIVANRAQSQFGRAAVICTMRDEGPYLLEWVAHHIACGFTDIYIAYNDCSDGTAKLLHQLNALGIIRLVRNQNWRGSPQSSAYRRAMQMIRAGEPIDWIMVIDADEMLTFKTGAGDLNAFFEVAPEANLYSFNWRLFGHGGHDTFSATPIAERFRRCGPATPWRAQAGVKTLFRNIFPTAVVSPHRPRWGGAPPEGAYAWLSGDGKPVDEELIKHGWRNFSGGMSLGQVNHYAVRDNESFLMKIARGRASNNRHGLHLSYWRRMSMNAFEDHSIDRLQEKRQNVRMALRSHRRIRILHKGAADIHRVRIAEARQKPEMDELYKALCAIRLRRPRNAQTSPAVMQQD